MRLNLLQCCSRTQLFCYLSLFAGLLFYSNEIAAQKGESNLIPRCGMEELVKTARGEGLYDENNKQYQSFVQKSVEQYEQREAQKTDGDCPDGVVVIPVAFHIFHNGGAVGTGINFSQAQLDAVLGSLNADFGGYNVNKDLIDECFQDVDAYNTCIQFCMGVVNRQNVTACPAACGGGTCDYTQLFNCSQEAPNDFLNIYAAPFDGGLLGVASSIPFPGNPFGNCIENNDGVYVNSTAFTIGAPANPPFDGGKTLTHEVGHWLGLYHIGGDGTCANDDGLTDTPTQNGQNTGCPAGQNDCNDGAGDKPDMYFNHMDYSDDACLAMFTQQQAAIMQAVLGYGDITGIPAPAGCRATLACSSQRGNCNNDLSSLDNTPNAANAQTINITDCSDVTSLDLLDIQQSWYGYATGMTCFNWVEMGAGDVSEIGDLDLQGDECGGMETRVYNLMMQPWDEANKTWGTEVTGGTVTVNIDCPEVVPTFATMPCAAQNNELSVTCPPCDCTFDNDNMKITVSLTGTHTWVSDLAFYLQAPDGTTVTMGSNSGTCNSGDDFMDLVFMSGASNTYDVCAEPTPLSGMFDTDFSALDGAAIGAGWNLIIGDCVAGDTGNLDSYTVTISDVGGGSCLTSDVVLTSSDGWPITTTDCAAAVTIPLTFPMQPGMADTPVWTAPDGTMTTGSTVAPVFNGATEVTYQVQCPCSDPCPKDVIAIVADCVPVELLAFTGEAQDATVVLDWMTASEIDNSHFEIERSFDGNKFETLGKVQGAGTTVELQSYNYVDLSPRVGVNYYRLKQVDFSGAFEYSDVVAVQFGAEKGDTEVYPSPTHDILNVKSYADAELIRVFDITGKEVMTLQGNETTLTQLNVSKLLGGTYFVSVQLVDGNRDVLRFVKN